MTLEKIYTFFSASGEINGDISDADFAKGLKKLTTETFILTDVSQGSACMMS